MEQIQETEVRQQIARKLLEENISYDVIVRSTGVPREDLLQWQLQVSMTEADAQVTGDRADTSPDEVMAQISREIETRISEGN